MSIHNTESSCKDQTCVESLLSVTSISSRNGKHIAAIYDDNDTSVSHTYQMIEKNSTSLKDELIKIILQNPLHSKRLLLGNVILVYGEENIWLPTIILGILKAKAAFFPTGVIIPGTDEIRLNAWRQVGVCGIMVPDSCTETELKIIKGLFDIVNDGIKLLSTNGNYRFISVNYAHAPHSLDPTTQMPIVDNLAYVALTSGSTGYPKVVKVPHSCIVPNVKDLSALFKVNCRDVVFLPSALTFDAAIVQLFVSLISGSSLLIVPNSIRKKAATLASILTKHKATVLQVTPSLISRLPEDYLRKTLFSASSSVRILALGGESFPPLSIVQKWFNLKCKPKLYNLYGVTEVSSWATCKEISWEDIENPDSFLVINGVSIGTCLSLTDVKMENEEILVGGKYRQCYISDDDKSVNQFLRNTGDLGAVINGEIYIVGRKDNQVKRYGNRFNLSIINSTVSVMTEIICSHALIVKSNLSEELVLFIQEITRTTNNESTLLLYAPEPVLHDLIMNFIKKELPSYCIPDRIICINMFPITTHGKLDKLSLLTSYKTFINSREVCSNNGVTSVSFVIDSWKDCLNISGTNPVDQNTNFINAGGSSFDCVKLYNKLEEYILLRNNGSGVANYSKLMVTIMEGSLSDIIHLMEIILQDEKKIPFIDGNTCSVPASKKLRTEKDFKEIQSTSEEQFVERLGEPLIHCSISWRVDLSKCIDGSPIIDSKFKEKSIYIGSHSGLFMKIDLITGNIRWSTNVGNRIEGSATLTLDEKYVVFGCHDNNIYVLHTSNGNVYWSIKTEGLIKSKPCMDSIDGLTYVCSYDHYLYCLDIHEKKITWNVLLGESSCHGGPVFVSQKNMIIIALLDGGVYAVCVETKKILWHSKNPKPIFSTPCIIPGKGICFGSVDGFLRVLDFNGCFLWEFDSSAPIFSSPLFVNINNNGYLIFGNHGSNLICLTMDGLLKWKLDVDSNIYVKALHFKFNNSGGIEPEESFSSDVVVCCSTKGTLYVVSLKDGCVLTTLSLPGMVFSSPVYDDNGMVIIGSRDDHIYSIKINKLLS